MSEWFYIKQWAHNYKKVWCVVDKQGNLLLSDVIKIDANSKKEELQESNIETYVVNKYDSRYVNLICKNRRDDENSHTKK
tara:strand:+ start:739 stop:978 length:240 start_codon:yes stop_codon:yes gene_type:complete